MFELNVFLKFNILSNLVIYDFFVTRAKTDSRRIGSHMGKRTVQKARIRSEVRVSKRLKQKKKKRKISTGHRDFAGPPDRFVYKNIRLLLKVENRSEELL